MDKKWFELKNIIMEKGPDMLMVFGLKLLAVLTLLFVGWIVIRFISNVFESKIEKSRLNASVSSYSSSALRGFLWLMLSIVLLSVMGVQTASLVAVLGAAGLAIGLALQGTLTNLAAGIMLVTLRPFEVGEFISAAGETGTVAHIGLFTTTIKSVDNKRIVFPNNTLASGVIVNFSREGLRRVDVVIGVSYDANIDHAKSVLRSVIDSCPDLHRKDEAECEVIALNSSSVDFAVRVWVPNAKFLAARSYLYESSKKALDAAGISIPFPHMDVRVIDLPKQMVAG